MPAPHGGILQDLIARDAQIKNQLLEEAAKAKITWDLTARQICDLELIQNGGFSPLSGFLNQKDYESVVHNSRLSNDLVWTIPITLDVDAEFAKQLKPETRVTLLQDNEIPVAILTVTDVYKPDKDVEAKKVFRGDPEHPAVKYLKETAGEYYVGGEIQAIQYPVHYDYPGLRKTPAQLRLEFESKQWDLSLIHI